MKKSINSILVTLLSAVMLGNLFAHFTGVDPNVATGFAFAGSVALSLAFPLFAGAAFNVVYSPILFTGEFYEEIFNEILFMNQTIEKSFVRIIDNVNTQMVLTESNISRSTQAYVEAPVSGDAAGTLTFADKILQPFQFMIYDEFTPNTIIYSRMGKNSSQGTAFPKVTDEYQKQILARYGAAEAELMESRFWNAATAATKVTVAALTPGTGQNAVGAAEQTYVAAAPTDFIDGIFTKLILSFSVTKRRIKVAGTTITASNIATEYAKVYAAILPKLLQPSYAASVAMFVPKSHLQLINTYNTNATYRDLFQVSGGDYFYNNVKINFVPLAENCIIAGDGMNLVWGCDVTTPDAMVKIDFLSANSEKMFIKAPYTQQAAFVQAQQFVVYCG